jgi:hypothetical protein
MAVQINFQITDKENEILTIIATRNNTTISLYCKQIIRGWIESQVRGRYQKEFNSKTLSELESLFGQLY